MTPVTTSAKALPARSLPMVAIVGATGTGKSDFALNLVESLSGHGLSAEIINADAMQLYRGMDIGTAKLPLEQRRGITHHLLDVWEVTTEASVAQYQALARACVVECHSRSVIPILVGGSGLYVSSVLYEFEFPGSDKAVRQALEDRLALEGTDALLAELQSLDPLAAAAIDPKNSRRLIRALEVIAITGKPFGAGLDAEHRPWLENMVILGLRTPREELVTALNQRVNGMWEAGLVAEVRALIPKGIERGVTASRAIGYQQALAQISGTLGEEEAIAETQALTRRYARRQVSWFSRDSNTLWCESSDPQADITALNTVLQAVEATHSA
jgi:tRNA dimethylallyltransferase